MGSWCESAAKKRKLECLCSSVCWLGWAGIHDRSCDTLRRDCRALRFCGRSQSINHDSLGCSFSAFLHFPIWTPLNSWGAGNRAKDKQQEEAALRQELLRNKEPLVPAAHAEPCYRMPRMWLTEFLWEPHCVLGGVQLHSSRHSCSAHFPVLTCSSGFPALIAELSSCRSTRCVSRTRPGW